MTPALILSLPFPFCFFLQPSLYLSPPLIDTYRAPKPIRIERDRERRQRVLEREREKKQSKIQGPMDDCMRVMINTLSTLLLFSFL